MRVALADDSVLFREGLAAVLRAVDVTVTAAASTGVELEAVIRDDVPDVVILDIRMPPSFTDEGIDTALRLRARHPGLGVLSLSTYVRTEYALRLLKESPAGVGYLLKDRVDTVTALTETLHNLHAGETVIDQDIVQSLVHTNRRTSVLDVLSRRERSVLESIAQGRSNFGIGKDLFLSVKTVETHVASIMNKLDIDSHQADNRRVHAVLAYLQAQQPSGGDLD